MLDAITYGQDCIAVTHQPGPVDDLTVLHHNVERGNVGRKVLANVAFGALLNL